MGIPLTKDAVLKKLETVYWRAMGGGNWSVALRAAELQGKAVGLFEKQLLPKVVRIADMTEEQLTEFINRLENRDPQLKGQEGEPAAEPLPEKETDGKGAAFGNLECPAEAAPAGENGAALDPPEATMQSALSASGDTGIEHPCPLYPKNPANKFILGTPCPDWEKPPPLICPAP